MRYTQLCYRSRISVDDDWCVPAIPGALERDLEHILISARRHNARADVTGALLLTGSHYFQLLEGPAEAVDATYRRIERDSRHSDLIMLRRRLVAQRLFPGQPVYFSKMLCGTGKRLPDLYRWYAEDPETVGGEALLDLLEQISHDTGRRRATAEATMF